MLDDGDWQIEVRQADVGGVGGHNYLVLRDSAGIPISSLHGYPDKDPRLGDAKLEVAEERNDPGRLIDDYGRVNLGYGRQGNRSDLGVSKVVIRGPETIIRDRRNAAIRAKDHLQTHKKDYSVAGALIGRSRAYNSNSVASGLLRVIGVDPEPFRDLGTGRIVPGFSADILADVPGGPALFNYPSDHLDKVKSLQPKPEKRSDLIHRPIGQWDAREVLAVMSTVEYQQRQDPVQLAAREKVNDWFNRLRYYEKAERAGELNGGMCMSGPMNATALPSVRMTGVAPGEAARERGAAGARSSRCLPSPRASW